MANLWYYTKDDQRMGPVSSDDLKRLAASGELKPDDLIWKEGLDDWKPASQLKGLFGDSPQTTAPGTPGRHPMFWQIGHIVAAVLLITAMFLPWWGLRIRGTVKEVEEAFSEEFEKEVLPGRFGDNKEPPRRVKRRRPKEEKVKKLLTNVTSSIGWYLRHLPSVSIKSNLVEALDKGDPDANLDIRVRIWGWHTNVGLSAGFIGFVLLPLSLVMIASAPARRFSFAASFLAAYAGFVLLVLSLIWYFDSPGWDMPPIKQGAHVGPYLALAGSFLVLAFGLLDGILGLGSYRRSLK